MQLIIDGKPYTLQEEDARQLISFAQDMMLAEYSKLDDNWQFLSKPIARTILQKMEESAKKKGATKEQALAFRPPKRQGPTEHLIKIISGVFFEAVRRVELRITTDGDRISSFTSEIKHQGESGGSLASDGDIRVGQDDDAEILRRGLHAPIPNDAALCP